MQIDTLDQRERQLVYLHSLYLKPLASSVNHRTQHFSYNEADGEKEDVQVKERIKCRMVAPFSPPFENVVEMASTEAQREPTSALQRRSKNGRGKVPDEKQSQPCTRN